MSPPAAAPFEVKDCALITLALGRSAQNLRELRDGIAEVPVASLSHHFYHTLLRPTFDDPEYRNDFALWARRQLHDFHLAERFAIIDPVDYPELEGLRQQLLDVVEDRLSESLYVPWAAPGREFHFMRSQIVVLDSGLRAATPAELGALVPRLPTGSIYYHFIAARRRAPAGLDDLSTWLRLWGREAEPAIRALAAIDFHLWSLTELREMIARCFAAPPDAGSGR